MFIILLQFGKNKDKAKDLMPAHNAWLQKGYDAGLFLLSGGLKNKSGGGILAHGTSLEGITTFVNEDPFVKEEVVTADITEIAAAKADERLSFLLSAS